MQTNDLSKVSLSRKDFKFWPEKFSSSILQRGFSSGVNISREIQISQEISTPGQKLRCKMSEENFSSS